MTSTIFSGPNYFFQLHRTNYSSLREKFEEFGKFSTSTKFEFTQLPPAQKSTKTKCWKWKSLLKWTSTSAQTLRTLWAFNWNRPIIQLVRNIFHWTTWSIIGAESLFPFSTFHLGPHEKFDEMKFVGEWKFCRNKFIHFHPLSNILKRPTQKLKWVKIFPAENFRADEKFQLGSKLKLSDWKLPRWIIQPTIV